MSKKNTWLSDISAKKRQIEKELKALEDNIYDRESEYLNDTINTGNLVKGWEYLLNKQQVKLADVYANTKKPPPGKFPAEERVFSKSSTTAPLTVSDYTEFQFQAPPIKVEIEPKSAAKVSSRRGTKKSSARRA